MKLTKKSATRPTQTFVVFLNWQSEKLRNFGRRFFPFPFLFFFGLLRKFKYKCLDIISPILTKCPCLQAIWSAVFPDPCSLDLIKFLSALKNATYSKQDQIGTRNLRSCVVSILNLIIWVSISEGKPLLIGALSTLDLKESSTTWTTI